MRLALYRKTSFVDPRLAVGQSPIHGLGVFSTAPIAAGEVLLIWGGEVFSAAQIAAGAALRHSYAAIGEELFLGHTEAHGRTADDYVNHSCDPTAWMTDEVTLVARRDLERGAEITIDYAMYLDSDWAPRACGCEAPRCRGQITSEDWRLPELQARYEGRFSPFINERIRRLRTGG